MPDIAGELSHAIRKAPLLTAAMGPVEGWFKEENIVSRAVLDAPGPDHLGDAAHGALGAAADLAHAPAEFFDDPRQQRRDGERNQRQFPIQVKQPAQQPDHRQRIFDHDSDYTGGGGSNLGDIES